MSPYAIKEPGSRRAAPSPIVNALREAVFNWRKTGYPGISKTSETLLNYWFEEEHDFSYYFSQREAIETLIYVYEVAKLRQFFDLWKRFDAKKQIDPRLAHEEWSRYVFKMATGSGKTKVMALAIVWSYFHKLYEADSTLSQNFVMIAPNIIVFERLKEDFGGGQVFKKDPLIPPAWQSDWNVQVLLQDEFATANANGNIYLTNIHRLFIKEEKPADNPVDQLLGEKPKGKIETTNLELREQILSHQDLVVINDEAHHVHDDELAWFKVITELNSQLKNRGISGLAAQLDFTATPRSESGSTFPQVIIDYPLAEAINDEVVKRPILPDAKSTRGFIENPDSNTAIRFKSWVDLGVSRWKKYRDKFAEGSKKKPILFIMTADTTGAAEVKAYLEEQHADEMRGKVLEIHTKANGELSETAGNLEYLQQLRQAARQIDSDENPYNAVVSVVMLREGWDVSNVTVVVGLRPFSAKANILPEQTIGRGLRKMVRNNPSFKEKVDIIGTPLFEQFVRELEKEDVSFEVEDMTDELQFKEIFVEQQKVDKYDISLPVLSPILTRESKNIEALTLDSLPKITVERKKYSAEDIHNIVFIDALTKDVDEEHQLKLEHPRNPESVITFFTKVLLATTKNTGQFAVLYPLVEGYIKHVLFGETVELTDKQILKQLSEPECQRIIYKVFGETINKATLVQNIARVTGETIKVSATNAFEWSRDTQDGEKQVFNLVAVDNRLEAAFADFLENADDVLAYAKNNRPVHFYVEYLGVKGNLHHYYTDFVARTKSGNYLIETKGQEDLEVAQKDARTRKWCEDATKLTGEKWAYVKVGQTDFEAYRGNSFEDLIKFLEI